MKVLFKEFGFYPNKVKKLSAVHAAKEYGENFTLSTVEKGVISWWRTNGREWVKVQ